MTANVRLAARNDARDRVKREPKVGLTTLGQPRLSLDAQWGRDCVAFVGQSH